MLIIKIRELEILKASLESDIINRQKKSFDVNKPAFKAWLEDSENLLQKVNLKLFQAKVREQLQEEKETI